MVGNTRMDDIAWQIGGKPGQHWIVAQDPAVGDLCGYKANRTMYRKVGNWKYSESKWAVNEEQNLDPHKKLKPRDECDICPGFTKKNPNGA